MAYLIDRQRAVYGRELVAIVSVRQRRVRSRAILTDNSLYHTLTRTKTFLRRVRANGIVWVHLGGNTSRRHTGAQWRRHP